MNPLVSYSGGTVKADSVFVSAFNAYKKMMVYLPEGYNPNGTTLYRVVYFLHGVNNNHTTYTWVYPILDSLIANNLIQPVIMVKPDGSAPPYLGSFYTNSVLYGPYEDWIYNYCVQYIDTHYKTKTDRNNRCIMGHSMGGYGTMKMAFKHTNLYRAVASHSGPLNFTLLPSYFPALLAESGGGPPYNYAPTNGQTSALAFTMCGAFTPNLSIPPYYVSFLLNPQGQLIDSLFQVFKLHCPARLSINYTVSSNLAIYFDCGLLDELGLLPWNNSFRDTLVARNIPYVYYTYTGTHTSQLPSRLVVSMKFLDSAMNHPLSIDPVNNVIPDRFSLYQNYPNPFNPVTKIKFDITKRIFVSLIVYDLLGKEVIVLVKNLLIPGNYEVEWNAINCPSGVYFYKLRTCEFMQTRKMILVK